MSKAKSFIKWVDGKTQLINNLKAFGVPITGTVYEFEDSLLRHNEWLSLELIDSVANKFFYESNAGKIAIETNSDRTIRVVAVSIPMEYASFQYLVGEMLTISYPDEIVEDKFSSFPFSYTWHCSNGTVSYTYDAPDINLTSGTFTSLYILNN